METACVGRRAWGLPARLIPVPEGALGAERPCSRCPGCPASPVMMAGFLGASLSEPGLFSEASHMGLGLKVMASP